MDTPFEREVEPRLFALQSLEGARAFVRWYIRISRAEPFGGFGARYGADLDLEGIGALIGHPRGSPVPDDRLGYRFLQDAVWDLCREGILRPGPLSLFAPHRSTGFSLTLRGEAWLVREGE